MIGSLTGIRLLRGIGLASGIAPHTKVFCDSDGYEAFAASFILTGRLANGTSWEKPITPELYHHLEGSYNRRNVYGAALAFAPRLPEDLRGELLRQAMAPESPLRQELAIPEEINELRVVITPCRGDQTWTYP